MKNKKLLSVLVSAVLLCACIAGVLMMGTSAEATTTTYEVGEGKTYATIKDALHAAAGETWAANSALVIEFTGEDKSAIVTAKNKLEGESTKLFFGQTTIFNVDGKKLPITIKGANADPYANKIAFAPGSWSQNVTYFAFANDYTFENLFIPFGEIGGTGGQYTNIFAGSGNVVFQNVEFLPSGQTWDATTASHTCNLYGDNFTMDAFYGWELAEGEFVETSITLGKNTEYGAIAGDGIPGYATRSHSFMSAVGYDPAFTPDVSAATTPAEKIAAAKEAAKAVEYQAGDLATTCAVKPINTKVSFILDSGSAAHNGTSWNNASFDFGTVRARRNKSPVAASIVNLKSGRAFGLATSPNTNSTYAYTGDIEITIESGLVSTSAATAKGYSINYFRGESLYGDLTVNIGGETENSTFVTSLFSTLGNAGNSVLYGTYTFNMTGGTLGVTANSAPTIGGTQSFGIMGMQGTITNITGGKINGIYYAANLNQGKGGTLPAAKIPAEYKEYIDGSVDVYNFIGAGANVETFAGGFRDNDNNLEKTVGNIVNVINGDGFTSFINGNYHGQTAAGKRYDTGFGNLTNIITGGTFEDVFYGNIAYDDYGSTKTIKNVVLDGTFYGFCGGSIYNTRRDVTNIIYKGTFNRSTTGFETNESTQTALTKLAYAYVGGGLRGESAHVTNIIHAANFPKTSTENQNYIGGVLEGNCGNITNHFYGTDEEGNIDIVFANAGSAILGNRSGSALQITNEIDSLVITNQVFYAGSWGGSCRGISNKFTGKTSIGVNTASIDSCKNICFGGGHSSIEPLIVNGNIVNEIDCEIPDATGTADYNFGIFHAVGRYATLVGDVTTTVKSGSFRTYNGGLFNGTLNGNATNIISDAIIGNDYTGAGGDHVEKLTNTITDTTIINHAYLGGTVAVENIENNLNGAIDFRKNVYGGGNGSELLVSGNVENNLNMTAPASGKNIGGVYYGGARTGSVAGTITNNFNSGSMGTFIGSQYDSTTGYTGKVINNINCGNLTYFASTRGTNTDSVENHIKATITFNFYGGIENATSVVGTVQNFIYDEAKFTKNFYGGSNNKGTISDKIVNTVYEGAEFGSVYYGGSTGASAVNGAVENIIQGGTFANLAFMGSASGTTGAITSQISGGTFKGHVYGGSQAGTVNGKIINTLSGAPDFATAGRNFYANSGDYANLVVHNGAIENFVQLDADAPRIPAFMGGRQCDSGDITNHFISGTFGSIYGGNDVGANGAILNEIGNIAATNFYGADGASATSITNKITGTCEIQYFYAAGTLNDADCNVETTVDAVPVEGKYNIQNYYGGTSSATLSIGNVTNTINSGTFQYFYGCNGDVAGVVENTIGAVEFYEYVGARGNQQTSISNTFNGTTVANHAYLGNGTKDGVVTGNIVNEFNGAVKFGGNTFGASGVSGATSTVKGTVTTVINATPVEGATNFNSFYAGCRNGSVEGKISNTINSGTFNNLYGGSYSGADGGTVADVETTIKSATVENYLRPNRNDANNATGEVKLTIDLSEGGVVTLLNQAKSAVASDEETIILKGGAGKLVIGAKTDLVADSVIDTVNIEMTEEPVKGEVYVTISGNVKASLNVTASEGITTPFVVVADGNTYVRGTGDSINAQLVIGEKIAVKVLFPVDFVGGFSYSWAGGSLEGTEKDLVLTNVFGKDYLALTLPALSLTEFESEFTFNAEGYEEAIFSILSLAEVAEAKWTDAKWVEVAKAIQNLNAVYNHKEANTMAPNLELGAPTTVGGSLKAEVLGLGAAPVMKGGAAGLKFTLSLANAPENFVVKVGDLDVTDKCLVTVNGTKVTVEIYFSAAHGCDNANIKFMDGDAKYLHVNTSVAQIAAVSAKAGNNNAAALVAFLQSVDAANN